MNTLRNWLTTHAVRRAWHLKLYAVGLTRADIKRLDQHPATLEVEDVLLAAQLGTHPDQIATHVLAARRVTTRDPRIDVSVALGLTARLNVVWGIPYDHAATLITHIADATEGAPDERD